MMLSRCLRCISVTECLYAGAADVNKRMEDLIAVIVGRMSDRTEAGNDDRVGIVMLFQKNSYGYDNPC